ncbi:MAG: permease YjgP/YjgQ family protein [Geminicoccaceae bacterium]|nr:permease YjgP/YjgQ family protein [Geminicoccaceae bacterium]
MREHVGPLVFALTALTSLLLLNYIAKRFGDLVGKGLGWDVIGEFFLLSLPFTVAMTLPMAVLVSTLYAFSRLAAENEITALKASGVGMTRVMIPVLLGATGIAAFMLFFNDQVLPRANHRLSTLQQDIARKKPTFALRSQVMNEVSPGKLTLEADYIDQSAAKLRVVTIYDMSDPIRRRTIFADSGHMALAGDDLILTLYDGHMQEVPKNDPTQLQRLFFDVDRIRVRAVANSLTRSDSTNRYKGDREMSICEMQRHHNEYAIDLAVARYTLERTVVDATRELATGMRPPPLPATSSVPPSAGLSEASSQVGHTVVPEGFDPRLSWSVGRAYCHLMAKLSALELPSFVRTASAAEVTSQQPTPKAKAAQDTTRTRRRIIMSGSAPPLPVPAPAPTPAPATPVPATDTTTAAAAPGGPGTPPVIGTPAYRSTGIDPSVAAQAAASIEASRSRMLENRTSMNRYGVEIHKKFALSAACMVFVLIGAPIALRFPRGGVGLVIGVSLVVFAIYYVGLIAGESLADRAFLTPFWAMWAANVILTGVGILLMIRMGREGATSRGGDLTEFTDAIRTHLAKLGRRFGLPLERRHKVA